MIKIKMRKDIVYHYNHDGRYDFRYFRNNVYYVPDNVAKCLIKSKNAEVFLSESEKKELNCNENKMIDITNSSNILIESIGELYNKNKKEKELTEKEVEEKEVEEKIDLSNKNVNYKKEKESNENIKKKKYKKNNVTSI